MKKITTLVLSLVLVLAMSITAFAATKDDVKKALKDAGVYSEYASQIDQFLDNNEITASEADKVVTLINDAKAIAGSKDLKSLSATEKSQIEAKITEAAKVYGAEVKFDTNNKKVVVTDKNNKSYEAAVNPVKSTGVSTTATVAGIAVLAMGLVACGVAVSKKRFA